VAVRHVPVGECGLGAFTDVIDMCREAVMWRCASVSVKQRGLRCGKS
jgi:hypothetical protein